MATKLGWVGGRQEKAEGEAGAGEGLGFLVLTHRSTMRSGR